MSKDIIIEQTGVEQALSGVEKIQTQPASGEESVSTVSWVPEDEVQLEDTLEITANGNYSAESSGVYGWKQVVVNVPMELSGSTSTGSWAVNMTADNRPTLTVS